MPTTKFIDNREITRQKVFKLLTLIPPGKVVTYKQVALIVGLSNPRFVSRILNTAPENLPCHRVIRSDGTVADGAAFGERFGQIVMLRQEGVEFLAGKTDLKRFGWQPSDGFYLGD